ncbi:MAG TPA: GPW/gp25 family protein [Pyrinomonadaceae bacterium]|nr:GPW/gp25 family protein [Pyrinomonadaceae bacterium]
MDTGRLYGRGISFPPRVGADGRVAWSEGEQNVREAIRVILLTEQRERLMLAEFGGSLGLFLFEPNTVTTRHLIKDRIQKALAAWEPRIEVEAVTVEEDPSDTQAAVATITYKLVATQARERVTLGVALAG